jgi:hypothetical protein
MENIFMQECECCGKKFRIKYLLNGSYEYIDEPCECESDFTPANSSIPSISQWIHEHGQQVR